MSTEDQSDAAQWNDKNLSDRPEADEDARTESSEDSNSKEQWAPDVMDSEDEFEDAMEPPSSGILMTFKGMYPISGFYEDAVEATPEQIAAALESTSSNGSGGGRHSLILEEGKEAETEDAGVEDEVLAVVQGVTPDRDAETEEVDVCAAVEGEVTADEVAKVNFFGCLISIIGVFADEEEVTAGEVVQREVHDTDEVPASEADAEVQEQAQSTEETTSVVESEAVYETANEGELEVARKNEEVSADEDVVAGSDDASDEAAEGIAVVAEPADDQVKSEAKSEAALEAAIVDEVEEVATGGAAEAELDAAVERSSQGAATDAVQEIEEAAPESTNESAPADEEADVVRVELTLEDEAAVVEEADPVICETEEPPEVDISAVDEVADQSNASVTEAAEEASAESKVVTLPEDDAVEVSAPTDGLAASEVEVAVAQITEELVQSAEDAAAEGDDGKVSDAEQVTEDEANDDANEDLVATDVPAQDAEAASTVETESTNDPDVNKSDLVEVAVETQANAEENPAEDEPVAAKEFVDGSRRKSDDEQSHAVVDLLPRLGTSSAPTTRTTTEPFIMSCESNEMLDVPAPAQRWSYDVYGFSIKKRVVLYHIHKTDRRAGVREPPILKRYTDFLNLERNLLDSSLRAAADIPRIPRPRLGTVLRGYRSTKTIEVREKAFRLQLRYIAQDSELHDSDIFARFITTSLTTTGAGWM